MTILLENLKGLRFPRKTSQIMNVSLCHKMGHIAINCRLKAEWFKKKNKRFQAHAIEDNDQEYEERAKENEYSREEYVLISALIGSVSLGNDTWLVDSGASKHTTGYKDSLSCLV